MPTRKMSPGGSRGGAHGPFTVRANMVTNTCRMFLLFPHSSVPLFVSSARKRNSCLCAGLPPNFAGPLGFVPAGARQVSFGLDNSGFIWLRAFLFRLYDTFAGVFRRAQVPVVDRKSSSCVDSGQSPIAESIQGWGPVEARPNVNSLGGYHCSTCLPECGRQLLFAGRGRIRSRLSASDEIFTVVPYGSDNEAFFSGSRFFTL